MLFSHRLIAGALLSSVIRAHVNAEVDYQISFGEGSDARGCHNACTALVNILGEKSYYKRQPENFTASLFSAQQREVVPACVIQPTTAGEVSEAVKVIKEYNCIFAVKSGGHCRFAGGSNAHQGITIDLHYMNSVEVSEDKLTTSVGPGARWGEVYKILEPMGLIVVGGRDSNVGVGGFILGGGISFISRRYGWALDNVRNFAVVLANGSIIDINYASHPDLYFALRGGGNNFGIVTRFDLDTYPQGEIWGGQNYFLLSDVHARKSALDIHHKFDWTPSYFVQKLGQLITRVACMSGYCTTFDSIAQAIEKLSLDSQSDPLAQFYCFAFLMPHIKVYGSGVALAYGKPELNPPIFNDYTKELKHIYSTNRIANMSQIAEEVSSTSPVGSRQVWDAVTFYVNATLMSKLFNIFISEIDPIRNVADIVPCMVMQLISKDEIGHFSKNGGNALGLNDQEEPLFLFSIAIAWQDRRDDEVVHGTADNIIARAVAVATEMGMYHRYIYQNYAKGGRDVFAGYGEKNKKRLQDIQSRYDPGGIFTRLQPGYFKL